MMNDKFKELFIEKVEQNDKTIAKLQSLDELLNSSYDRILSFLQSSSDAKAWLVVVLHFYTTRNESNLKSIVKELLKVVSEDQKSLKNNKHGFISILNVLTIFFTFLFQKTVDKQDFEEFSLLSTKLINTSEKLEITNSLTLVAKGYLLFAKGEYENSEITFNNSYDKEMSTHNANILVLALLGKALNCYIKSKYSEAINHITTLIKKYYFINEGVLECLGICYYNIGKEVKAFQIFKKVLEINNKNYKALCYLALLELSKAYSNCSAFDQASEMLLLAFENLVESKDIEYCNSYHLVLSSIIDFFIKNKNFNVAEQLRNRLVLVLEQSILKYSFDSKAIKSGGQRKDIEKIKSNLHCINGKIAHFKRLYSEAFAHYTKAVQYNSNNIEALFALGQLNFYNQNYTEALRCFEGCKSTQDFSSLYEVNKFIALLQSRTFAIQNEIKDQDKNDKSYYNNLMSRLEELVVLFTQLIEIKPQDIDCMIELAQILEYEKPQDALSVYEQCLDLIDNNNAYSSLYQITEIYPELINNIASLKLSMRRPEGALELLIKSKKLISAKLQDKTARKENEEAILKIRAVELAVVYNLAYCYEQLQNYPEAYRLYKSIISFNPYFVDAYSKLGIYYYNRGNYKKAFEYLDQAIEKHYKKEAKVEAPDQEKQESKLSFKNENLLKCMPKPINPMLIKAIIQCKEKTRQDSLKTLSLIMSIDAKDPYLLILIGNINYELAFQARVSSGKSNEYQKRIAKALDFYNAALEIDIHNAYAAIGIANCFAEFDMTGSALEIYKSTGEKLTENYSRWVNEAILFINDSKLSKAIPLLQKAVKRMKESNNRTDLLDIEMLLVKVYLDNKDYEDGLTILRTYILKFPEDLIIRFNYGVALKMKAEGIISNNQSKVKNLNEAKVSLEKAIPIFEGISKIRKESKLFITVSFISLLIFRKHMKKCCLQLTLYISLMISLMQQKRY